MVKVPHKLVKIVKGNRAILDHVQDGILYYTIDVDQTRYTLPIDMTNMKEFKGAVFLPQDKASIFMRYINMATDALEGDDSTKMLRWEPIPAVTEIVGGKL